MVNPVVSEPKSANKMWLIGCGGCLGVILILAIIALGITMWGVNAYNENNTKVSQSLFGGKPPETFTPLFGMTVKNNTNVMLMVHKGSGHMLVAFETPMKGPEIQALKNGNPAAIAKMAQDAMEQGSKSSRSIRHREAKVVGYSEQVLLGGKKLPIIYMQMEQDEDLIPCAIALIPKKGTQGLVLMSLDPARKGGPESTTPPNQATYTALGGDIGDLARSLKHDL
ncbi:MAG: hypothetical protein K2X01_06090 [Cyanobacteria bacterium]|nr:hypothetical protein [Cyanobacteriota bacterium]